MVTLTDVARLADVSPMTVSRVVNGDPSVRPRTRRLVLEAIAELGYVPNVTARALSNARTGTIGLVVSDLRNPAGVQAVEEIAAAVAQRGYSLLLCDSCGDDAAEAVNLRRLLERRVEGLILFPLGDVPDDVSLFEKSGIPLLLIGASGQAFDRPHIRLRGGAGVWKGLKYLSELGHRRVALIRPDIPPYGAGVEDSRNASRHADLEVRLDLTILGAKAHASCSDVVARVLAKEDRPTAVLSAFHSLTPYVLVGIRRAGLRIPADVSLVTLGDSPWAAAHSPSLTAISHQSAGWGRLAADYIFARIGGEDTAGLLRDAEFELIARESCAPPGRLAT